MTKISWNPKGTTKGQPLSPIAWGCYIYMREDVLLKPSSKERQAS
jgi:hypothetical protein